MAERDIFVKINKQQLTVRQIEQYDCSNINNFEKYKEI